MNFKMSKFQNCTVSDITQKDGTFPLKWYRVTFNEPINAEQVLLYLYLIDSFKEKMLQAANTDLFNPVVPKAQK